MLKACLYIVGFCFTFFAVVAAFGMIRGTLPVADGILFAVASWALAYLHLSATDGTPLASR